MIAAPSRISIPSIAAARFSTFSWPYGCVSSAGSSALRTEKKATSEAIRSILEWTASVMIAIDPVMTPAASFRAISTRLETIDTVAARVLGGICAAGPIALAGEVSGASSASVCRPPASPRGAPAPPGPGG